MKDFSKYPYGAYLCAESVVYFDRRYQPIVRVSRAGTSVCNPREWIEHTGQEWLYTDANSPARSQETRNLLRHLLTAIPALADEVRRRSSKRREMVA